MNNNNNNNTNSDKEWLYGKLKNGGLNVSYEDFDKTLGNEEDRKWYYDKATKMGLKVGSYDDFINIFAKPQKPISVAQQVIDEYDASMRNAGVQTRQTQQSAQPQPAQPQPMFDGSQFNAAVQVPDWTTQEQKAIENVATSGTATPATDEAGQPVYPVKPQEVAYDEAVQELRENMPQPLNVQLKSLQDDVSVLRDENKKKLKRYAGSGSNAMSALMGSRQYMQASKEDRQEAGALDAAERLLNESQDIVDESEQSGKTNFVSGLLRGVRDNAFDAEQWTFGLADMADSAYILRAVQKAEKGEHLTPAEEKLLDASVMNMAINAYYGDMLGRGYKAGKVTAQSLPFMLEFAVNPVSSSGSAIAKNLLKYGMKKFGASVVNRAIPRAAARLVGDTAAAAAMTGTTGAGRVASEAMNKVAGNYEYGRDDEGVMQAVKTGDMSVGEAIARGFGTTLLENQSEMIFNAFRGGGTAIKNAISESVPVLNKLSNSDIVKAVRNIKNNPVAKNLRERTQIGGVMEEYAEEVYNNLANVAMGEMSAEDALSLDNNVDTFLGLVPTQLAFSAIGLGGFARDNAKARRNVREFEQTLSEEDRELFSELREVIQSGNTELPKDFIKATLADANLTDELKKERIFAVKDMVSEKQSDELQEELETEEDVEPAMTGEELEANKVGIHRNYVRAERKLNSTNLPAGLKEELYGGGMTMRDIMATYDLDDAQIDAVTSFMDAKKANDAYNGYVESMALQQRQAAQEQATQEVESIGNPDMGNVVQATRRTDGNPVNIVGGVLAYNEEGLVDKDKSSDVIYYVDENGERKMSTADEFENVVGDVPFQQYIDEAASSAEQEYYAQQQASLMSPEIPAPEKGVTFSLGWNNYVVNGITPEGNVAAYKLNDMGEIDTENGGYIELAPEDYYSAQETAMWGEPAQEVDKVSEIQAENAVATSGGESIVSETAQEETTQPKTQEQQPVLSAQQQEIEALRNAGASEEALSATITQRANDAKKALDKAQKAMNAPFKAGVDPVTEIHNRKNALEAAQAEYEAWNSMMPVQEETAEVVEQPQEPVSVEETVQGQPAMQEEQPISQQDEEIPTDEQGNVLYHRVPVDTTVREINSSLEAEEVDAFISENKKEADKELKAIEKNKPKVGTNIAKYKAEKQAWQELMSEAQAKADYWNDVESEVKNLRTNIGDETAEEIRNMGEPMDGLELAARELASGYYPLLRSDYMRETGYSEDEVKNMFGLFRSKENGGMMLDVAGEKLMQADLDGNYNFFDQSDPNAGRNAIIEVLSQAKTRGDLINYIKRRREEQAKRESEAEYNAYQDWVEKNFQMSVQDYEAYMDRMEKENPFEGVDNAELDAILAEAAQEYEQLINNEEYGRDQETGVDATTEGGNNVLPEQQSDNEGAVTGSTEERAAEEDGEQSGVDDGAAQGEAETKPVTASKINKGENIFDYARRLSKEKEIADARQEVDGSPTDAQKEAGNYKKGHVSIDGLDITIENGKGSTRTGTDARGKVWSVTMQNDYGYIRGTKAVDGDHIDIFLSDNPTTGNVYVVDAIDQETGEFDESKVMYGFESADAAREAYLSNYEEGWKVGTITEVSKDEFKKWIDSSTEKRKPFSEYKSVQESGAQNEEADDVRFREVDVNGEKTLIGVHNISEEKFRKSMRMGGFANPSAAVIDISKQSHEGYGEISLLLPSSMIEKRTGRNAGTFENDAWTPIYPQVERQFSGEGDKRSSQDIQSVPEGMRNITRNGITSWMDGRSGRDLSYLFLHERGKAPELVLNDNKYDESIRNSIIQSTNGGFSLFGTNKEEKQKILDAYIEAKFNGDKNAYEQDLQAKKERMQGLLNHQRSLVRKRAQDDLNAIDEFGFDYDSVSKFVRDVENDVRYGGKVNDGSTVLRAQEYIENNGLQKEFEKWLDGLNDRYEIKEVIFNGFTPSGTRRYIPNTLENVSAFMKKSGRSGATGFSTGFNNFAAGLLKAKGSLKDIRKGKGKLTSNHDDVEAFRNKWGEVFYELGMKLQPGAREFEDYGLARLSEAAKQKNPNKYLRDEYGIELSEEDINKLNDMIRAIREEYPAMYFETKFERPVYLSEFAAAVVPDNASDDVIKSLKDAGLTIVSYKHGDNNDRKKALEQAANNDIRFRRNEGINEIESSKEEITSSITELSSQLNTPIRMVNSLDEVTNRSAKRAIENGRKVKAWFEPSTGEVVVYMPNATSVNDVKRSVLHEVVGHKGLRELIGEEEYDKQMEKLYGLLPEKERAKVENAANKKYGSNIAVAMDEYLAEQAERDEIPSWWNKAVSAVRDMLRSIGINVELTDGDVKYLLWRSRKKLMGKDVFSLADDISMRENTGIYPDASYREGVSNEQEIQSIIEKAKADGTYMKAPNGNPTNLTERQWAQVRTKSFKDWFGDWENDSANASKVVDENGEPKVVYHGTINKFNEFDKNAKHRTNSSTPDGAMFFTSDEEIAISYGDAYNGLGYVIPVFLNIKKPDIVIDYGGLNWDGSSDGFSAKNKNNGKTYRGSNGSVVFWDKKDLIEDIKKRGKNVDDYILNERYNFAPSINSVVKVKLTFNGGIIAKNIHDVGENISGYYSTSDEVYQATDYIVANPSQIKSATENTGDFDPTNPDIRYRTGDGTIEDYERYLETRRFKAREAYQDSMLALKKLQEAIEKKDGVKLKASENAYMAENQMSSKSTRESEVYGEKFFKPMIDEVAKLVDKGIPYDYIKKYVMAKHGLERNEVFARRDAEKVSREEYRPLYQEAEREHNKGNMSDADYQARMTELDNLRAAREDELYNENRQKDYSGLSSLMETQTDYEVAAQDFVDAFEQSNNVSDLWKAINAATEQTLKKSYESGMMSKSAYDKVRNQFKYYVPLRGWNEDTAEDVYEYLNSETSPVNSVLKSAKGRTSVADDPFATIGNMAESTILQGNRNEMKQKFLNMAINHPSDVLSVGKVWYVLDNATGEWVMSMPDIQEGDTADVIADKIDKHRERMLQLRENGEAVQQKANLDIDYRIGQRQAKEHAVIVKLNGEDYVVYVNGNPRAAQAVNGMTNPDVEQNKIFEGISRFNRWMAANFTTRNPAFVLSNLSRDLIFSMSAVAVKEDSKYSSAFRRNIPSTMKAIARGLRGVQPNTEADKYFQEFLDNGGETGYTALHNVDEYKKMIDLQLKKAMNKTDYFKAVRLAAGWFSNMNRWAEDVSRFNAYKTSRQMGRSIAESVNDAKEITVNFNKKGSGYKTGGFFGFTSGASRNLYLFFNAAIQSLSNFAKLAQKNKKGFTALLGGFATAGFLVPMLNSVIMELAGGDDDDYYQNLPEWTRRNNLCLYVGGGRFLTIPLPIELRAFYGLGEMAYQATIGKDKYASENVAYAAINQITELLPINPLGNQGDLVTTFMPDAIKPFWQIKTNTSFTGIPIYKENSFNENMPEWTKVYKGTSPALVSLSEWTNEIAGGDKYQKAKHLEPIMNWNPAKVESLFESIFGGMATTINQTGKTLGGLVSSAVEGDFEDNVQTRNIPILNRFLNNASDDRMTYSNINRMYYSYYELYKEIDQNVRGYSKEASRGSQEYLEKLRELSQSEDFPIYQVFKSAKKQIDKLNKMEKSLPESKEEERKEIQKSIADIKKSVVDRIIELKKKNK